MIHIGKTGGSALKTMFMVKAEELNAKGVDVRGRKHTVTLQDMIQKREENIIFFVRHPVSRFVSAFNSRLRQGLPRYNSPWNRSEEIAFSRFKEPNELAEALSSEDPNVSTAAKWDMQSINHVKEHMSKWLISKNFLEANRDALYYIGTTETMDEDVIKLFEKMGVAPPDADLGNVHRHETPVGYSKTLSDKAVTNLTQWYAEDIGIYQWCADNRSAINAAPLR